MLTLPEFVAERQTAWADLRRLVDSARGNVTRLDADSVRELGSSYRDVAADLALARRRFPRDPVTTDLDQLIRQARPLVYGTPVERSSTLEFATTGYWRRIAERPVFLVIATLMLFAPAIILGFWAHENPTDATRVAGVSELSQGIAEGGFRDPDTDKETDIGRNSGFSAMIFTNNARVALVAFAGGLTAGVLTTFSLVFNGLILGLIGGLAVHAGAGESLWRLVAPHGVLELSLIVVAGAAGLRTGWAILRPGHRTRTEALVTEGRAGLEMALGSAALLVPTGLVEGFVTPRGLTLGPALAVGFGLGIAFWVLVVWRGRRPVDAA